MLRVLVGSVLLGAGAAKWLTPATSRARASELRSAPTNATFAKCEQARGGVYRWRVEGATEPFAMNLCAGTVCVPVSYDGESFEGAFESVPVADVVVRWMWRDVPWASQVTRRVVDFRWEGCAAAQNFVNTVVCTWPPPPGATNPPASATAPKETPAFAKEFYVGDSNMKRLYDARLRTCRSLSKLVKSGKLHEDASTTCDKSETYYVWSAGFDDTSLRLDAIPRADDVLVVTNTGHNYINLGPIDFETFATRLSHRVHRFAHAYLLEPPAMTTALGAVRFQCAQNNVVVQRRIAQLRAHLSAERIVPVFWETLGRSGQAQDNIHYAAGVYDAMLRALWRTVASRDGPLPAP